MATVNGIQTFECIVNVSGHLDGGLDDWPSNIQDGVYKALEDTAAREKLPLAVVYSACEYDIDDGHYLRIVLSEVVTADERAVTRDAEFFAVQAPKLVN